VTTSSTSQWPHHDDPSWRAHDRTHRAGRRAARIEDGNSNVDAVIHGHDGSKNDDAWIQRLTASDGTSLGALTLVRRLAGFQDLYKWLVAEVWLTLNVNQRYLAAG
jgi:hypothetical protein